VVLIQVKFNYAMPMDDFVYGSEFTAPFNINARVKRAFDACVRATRRVMGAGDWNELFSQCLSFYVVCSFPFLCYFLFV
jgi:hypothetical protein